MGRLNAEGMAAALPLDAALAWHLQHNHFPPVPSIMLPVAKRAVLLARSPDCDWTKPLRLPKGVTWRGAKSVPLANVVESFHLDAFIEQEDES